MQASEIMVPVQPIRLTELTGFAVQAGLPANLEFLPVADQAGCFIGTIELADLLKLQHSAEFLPTAMACINSQTPRIKADYNLNLLPKDINRAVVEDGTGQIIGVIGAANLLDYYRKTIAEVKQQFFAIINSAHNGILAVNEHGAIILLNKAAEDVLGLDRSEVIGQPVASVIPNTLMPVILQTQTELLGKRIEINGVSLVANYAPILINGQLRGAVSVFQDISSMEKMASELSNVQSLIKELETIIESSYDGIWITDGECNVLRVNSAYERITGIKRSEVIGKNMQQLVDEGFFDQSASLLVMKEKKRVTINQIARGNRILVTGNPIFDEKGNITRILTNVRDITELVNLQNQLAKSQEQTLKYQTELSHLRALQVAGDDIVCRSPSMARALELAIRVADVESNVLITGESGTGKDVIAKFIHKQGKGVSAPFIKINCAAIPEQLLESELFGYEGGAFSGARREGKPGLIELAHNGTLFLDEVGELPLRLQPKLLRVIQEKEVIRLGGTKARLVNVRIIAATNRDIAAMVKSGAFRQDLYYRLMVVPIHLAPLRERKEDIPPLIMRFVDSINKRYQYSKRLSPEVFQLLVDYDWPGNVRELENVLERMLVTAIADELTVDLLPEEIARTKFVPKRAQKLKAATEQMEAYILAETYRENPSWPQVAKILGINRATVFRKAAKYGLLKKNKQ